MAKRIKETVFNERDRNIPTFLLPQKTVHQQKSASGSKAQGERPKRFPIKEDPITAKRRKETVFEGDMNMSILLVALNTRHSTSIIPNKRKDRVFNERDYSTPILSNKRKEAVFNEIDYSKPIERKETVFNKEHSNVPKFLGQPNTFHQQKAVTGSKTKEKTPKRFAIKEEPIMAKRRKETVLKEKDKNMSKLLARPIMLHQQEAASGSKSQKDRPIRLSITKDPKIPKRRKETVYNERDRNISNFGVPLNTLHQQEAATGSKTKKENPKRIPINEELVIVKRSNKETVYNEKDRNMPKFGLPLNTLHEQEAVSGSETKEEKLERFSIKEEPMIAKRRKETVLNERDRNMPKQEAASGFKTREERPKHFPIKEEPIISKRRKETVVNERDRNMPKQEAASGFKTREDRPKRLSMIEEPIIGMRRRETLLIERDRNIPPQFGMPLYTLYQQEAASGYKTREEKPKRFSIKEEPIIAKRRKETVVNEGDRNIPKPEAASGFKTREERSQHFPIKEEPIISKRRKETVLNERDNDMRKLLVVPITLHEQEAASGSKTREENLERFSIKEEPIIAKRRKETVVNERDRNIPKQEAASGFKTREERPEHFPIKEETIISKRRKETVLNERDNDMRKSLVIPITLHEQEAASGSNAQKERSIRLSTKEKRIRPQTQEEPPVDLFDIEEQPEADNHNVISRVMEIFPDAHPNFVKKLCRNKEFADVDDIVTEVLSNESYPRRQQTKTPRHVVEYNIEEQLEIVQALLPDADPTYLRCQCEKFGRDTEQLTLFVNEASDNKNYPTMKEHLRKQKVSTQCKQYTTEFDVEKYVDLFPDPEKTFRYQNRQFIINGVTSYEAHTYLRNFFRNKYDTLAVSNINNILMEKKNNILSSDDEMRDYIKRKVVIKCRRKPIILEEPPKNIAILQELAYLTHKEEIETCINRRKQEEEKERKMAKEKKLLNTCQCCFDDEVVPKDTFCCPNGCSFCRSCIQKSCEVTMGDGKTNFNCLNHCSDEFSLQTLQKVLPPKLFSNLAKKKALAEVKAAGIEELECCPFCDFASIPYPNDKVFRCLDPDCMKESCRLCKEENHIPYKCHEIEQADDVKARVFVENKMTEALLRKCWNCKKSFFKEEGCNKMTCSCGAQMCYICHQPLQEKPYAHFNGLGGTHYELCPLYTDTNDFNQTNVIEAAELAKTKIDPSKLKIDPTLDVKEHYEKRKEKLPQEPHIRILQEIRNAEGAQAAP